MKEDIDEQQLDQQQLNEFAPLALLVPAGVSISSTAGVASMLAGIYGIGSAFNAVRDYLSDDDSADTQRAAAILNKNKKEAERLANRVKILSKRGGDPEVEAELAAAKQKAEALAVKANKMKKVVEKAKGIKIGDEMPSMPSGKASRRKIAGAQKLQAAGFRSDLDPTQDFKAVFDQFYSAVDQAGLGRMLGRKDYNFGPKHAKTLKALKSTLSQPEMSAAAGGTALTSIEETKQILDTWRSFVNEEKKRELIEEKQINNISNQILKEYVDRAADEPELLQEVWPAVFAAARLGVPWALRAGARLIGRASPQALRRLGYKLSSRGNPMRIPGGAGGGSPGTTALARTIKKATDLAKRHPTINAASKSFAEFAAWTAVGDAAVGAYNYVAGADEEQGEGTEYGTISTAAAKVDDAIAKLKAAEGTADESQAVKDLEKELGKATSEAKSVVGKQKQQMKKIGGMKLKGAQTLQAAGFGKGVDPGENHRKIYDEFYAKIDAAGLNSVLGKKDYLFGKKHQAALSALKSKKPAVKDKPSTDVKIAGTQAANVAAKVAKKIKSVARFTYKSPGEAIRAAAGGILDPGYADNPSVKAALEKFKQS